jgi:hypothetical protein
MPKPNKNMTNTDTEDLWAEVQRLKTELYSAKELLQQRYDESYRLNTQLTAELKVTRRLLAKAYDEVEAERNRIIAASDAAFRYINRHNK